MIAAKLVEGRLPRTTNVSETMIVSPNLAGHSVWREGKMRIVIGQTNRVAKRIVVGVPRRVPPTGPDHWSPTGNH